MAKRRKPRPTGPPPAKSPKLQRIAEGTEQPRTVRRAGDEPRPPSMRGVVVRAVVIAVIYALFLMVALKEDPAVAGLVGLFGFALMIPLGMLLDRMRYRSQLKRWRQQRGIPEPTRAAREPAAGAADDTPAEDA
ncbi:MAG: hypothetical protein KDC33_01465 [Thermoleophilia bacterium]|nr:hypothetical protein [Thermoleophilia bacterium]